MMRAAPLARVALLLALACLCAAQDSLFTSVSSGDAAAAASIPAGEGVATTTGRARQNNVATATVNTALLASSPDTLSIQLPAVGDVICERAKGLEQPLGPSSSGADGSSIWVGNVRGARKATSVCLVQTVDGAIFGTVTLQTKRGRERRFTISPTQVASATAGGAPTLSSDSVVVYETKAPRRGGEVITPTVDAGAAAGGSAPVVGGRKLQQVTNLIFTRQDLLAVYTNRASVRYGGTTYVVANIRASVAVANKAYLDSNARVVLNLVDIRKIQWDQTVSGNQFAPVTEADPLEAAQSGAIPDLHQWRDDLGADLVAVYNDNNQGGCRSSYLITSLYHDAAWAYSSIKRGCYSSYDLAAAVSMNQGCGASSSQYNPGIFPNTYSFGYSRCDLGPQNFWTLENLDFCGTGLGVFSNPSINVVFSGGAPAGNPATANCARNINETAQAVTDFRPSRVIVDNTIVNVGANQCLRATVIADRQPVHMVPCVAGDNNARWQMLSDGSLRVLTTQRCLEVVNGGTSTGTALQITACTGSLQQRFFIDNRGSIHPYNAPDRCLEVAAGVLPAPRLNWCNWLPPQNWTAPQIQPVFYPYERAIRSQLSSYCIFENGAGAQLLVSRVDCFSQTTKWSLDTLSRLRVLSLPDFCATAMGTTAGSWVRMQPCAAGSPATLPQRWFMDPLARLRPYNAPTLCLAIIGANPANAAPLELADCADVPEQKWWYDNDALGYPGQG